MSPFKVTGVNVAFQPVGNSGWGGRWKLSLECPSPKAA